MYNLYLFNPQYGVDLETNKGIVTTYWLPYATGCLWAYVKQFKDITDNFELKELIFKREDPQVVVDRLDNPKVCGFSNYVWNENYLIECAKLIKEKYPDCVMLWGGPNTNAEFVNKYDFVDVVVSAEGEVAFLQMLRDIKDGKQVQRTYSKQRIEDLSIIPSPYLEGIFDDIIASHPDNQWVMTYETNRGCPYMCTFCDWGGTTYSKTKVFPMEKVLGELSWCEDKPVNYLSCTDANFGIFKERDLEIAKHCVKVAKKNGLIDHMNFQYAKNQTEQIFEIAKAVGGYSRGITISVQSMSETVLSAIKRRNMKVNKIKDMLALSNETGVKTYTEVILGLPEETLESWREGLCELLELGQHSSIDMWFAQLIRNSEMNLRREEWGIKSIWAKDYYSLISKNDYKGQDEDIEIITATNTMSESDMLDSWMYGFLIVHWHIMGYTQFMARWLREECNIPYRAYYDRMFEMMPAHPVYGKHWMDMRGGVQQYLKTGRSPSNARGHHLHSPTYKFLYDTRFQAYDLSLKVAKEFVTVPDWVYDVQKNFLFDPNTTYPLHIHGHKIESRVPKDKVFDWYRQRRQGYLKNAIHKYIGETTYKINHDHTGVDQKLDKFVKTSQGTKK